MLWNGHSGPGQADEALHNYRSVESISHDAEILEISNDLEHSSSFAEGP